MPGTGPSEIGNEGKGGWTTGSAQSFILTCDPIFRLFGWQQYCLLAVHLLAPRLSEFLPCLASSGSTYSDRGGLRLNLSKSGIGASVGRTGLRLGLDAKRRKYFLGRLARNGIVLPHVLRAAGNARYPQESGLFRHRGPSYWSFGVSDSSKELGGEETFPMHRLSQGR